MPLDGFCYAILPKQEYGYKDHRQIYRSHLLLQNHQDLEYICCHHEQACAMAAESYFRLSGKLAALNVTAGPGAINTLNGVFGAYVDSMGMIVISGQAKRETMARNYDIPLRQLGDQEVDIVSIVRPITKYATVLQEPEMVKKVMGKAIFLATHGRPGPVWIDVPIDVQAAPIVPDNLPTFDPEDIESILNDKDLADNTKGEFNMSVDYDRLRERANFVRTETVRLIEIAKCGHYTSVFSAAEIISVLYYHVMKLSDDPDWPDRDRFLMSKGHMAVGLYPILADLGYFPKDWLDSYALLGSALGDHPDMRKIPGIDFSSGSLGHNLSNGVGMALGLRLRNSPARVFVIMGDGEQNEGQIWEGAQAASQFKVDNLVGIIDRNELCLDGATEEIMSIEPLADKWSAFGWNVHVIDGHSIHQLVDTFKNLPQDSQTPQLILAKTVKGKGLDFMEGTRLWHVGLLAGKDAENAVAQLQEAEGE